MFKKLLKQAKEKGRSFFTECSENWYLLSDDEKKALFTECYLTILDTEEEETALDSLKEYNTEMFRSVIESNFWFYLEYESMENAFEYLNNNLFEIEDKQIKEELEEQIKKYWNSNDINEDKRITEKVKAILERTL